MNHFAEHMLEFCREHELDPRDAALLMREATHHKFVTAAEVAVIWFALYPNADPCSTALSNVLCER